MSYTPDDVGRAHALQFLALHCDDRAEWAENALTRAATADDRAYLRAHALTMRRTADRLRSSPGFILHGDALPARSEAA